jgi:hypothetical protein
LQAGGRRFDPDQLHKNAPKGGVMGEQCYALQSPIRDGAPMSPLSGIVGRRAKVSGDNPLSPLFSDN